MSYWQQKLINIFEDTFLHNLSSKRLFNFYRDEVPFLDRPNGAYIRWRNLCRYIYEFGTKPKILLVGEAPGARGCRFSGIPFTSEKLITEAQIPVRGDQSSRRDSPQSEITATIFWKTLHPYVLDFFVWNVVPFHPHRPDDLLSNRPPTRNETSAFLDLLLAVINVLEPEIIVAVGKTAYRILNDILNIDCTLVRHPSYGGKRKFQDQMIAIMSRI